MLRASEADSYIIKHETSDPLLNERMRHDSFDERMRCIEALLTLGCKVGTGTIVGLPGQTTESLAEDILLAIRSPAERWPRHNLASANAQRYE